MKTRSILNYLKPVLLAVFVGISQAGHADTRTYAATTDFPVTDTGVVPYYSEAPERPSLAINAAIESYRDLYARAEVVYDGDEGIHEITIVALAELDGEAQYNLLVNGTIVGTASNPEVTVDYTVVRHRFPNIAIPVGAVIAVESLANTNGKIPEGDGTAFARGRWTALELVETNSETEELVVQTPTDIDLNLSVSSSTMSVNQNEPFSLTVTVANAGDSITATQPEVEISLALQAITIVSADQCAQSTLSLTCTFPEIPAGTSSSMTLSLSSTDETLTLVMQATASAEQNDRDGTNNMANFNIVVNDSEVPPEPEQTVDSNVTNQTTPDSAPTSGGGGFSLAWLLLFFRTMIRSRNSI